MDLYLAILFIWNYYSVADLLVFTIIIASNCEKSFSISSLIVRLFAHQQRQIKIFVKKCSVNLDMHIYC